MENQEINIQHNLPNSTGVLVLGILSIVFCCCCYGIIGDILSIIAIVLASKANKLYLSNPSNYSESSYKNMKAGKVCAIVGLCLSGFVLVCTLIYLALYGTFLASLPWQEMMNQY